MRPGASAVIALAAAATALLCVRDASGAGQRVLGLSALSQAVAMERGAERDALLDRAQDQLASALDVYASDAEAWRAVARTRYLQATGAEVTSVSPRLLQAAVVAARRAETLDPSDPIAPGQIAQAMSVWPQADKAQAAAALHRSYLRQAINVEGGFWRVQTAAALWPALDAQTKQAALAEACLIARSSPSGEAQVQVISAAAPDMAAAFTQATRQAFCAPDSSLRNPGN